MKMLLIAAAMLLSACTVVTPPEFAPSPPGAVEQADEALDTAVETVEQSILEAPPKTLERTTIDDKAIRASFQSFEAALTVVDALVATGVLVPGSARALTVKRYLVLTRDCLNAASAAQRAGSATDYAAAFEAAGKALAHARSALSR